MQQFVSALGSLVIAGMLTLGIGASGGSAPSATGTTVTAIPGPAPAVAVAGITVTASPRPGQASVVLYGDSLAWEAEEYFRDALLRAGVADVWTRTHGGTAICDYLDQMRRDAAELTPTVVVVEFSGNAFTPCMVGPDGVSLAASRDAYHQKYAHDAAEVLDIFSGSATRVIFAGAPWGRGVEERHDPDANWLNRMYSSYPAFVANAQYVDAGAVVLRDGHWTETLPCLAAEPCTGGTDADGQWVNVVRAPDGGHFCPDAPNAVRGVTSSCSVWSSGAYRYGHAMSEAVLASLA
jgi:hypothetical protein